MGALQVPPATADRSASLSALEFVLGSESTQHFISDVLGKRHLLCQDPDQHRFADLLSIDVLDSVLGRWGLKRPDIRLVQLDRDIPAREYEWRNELVDPTRVARLFSEGATVVFSALQDRHEPLRQLCAGLARDAGGRTQTNIYLTPPGSQGFKAHWDTHDVFVLQVSGSKRWRIYEGGPDNPLKHQKFDPERHHAGDLQSEFTLSAGETLYIPRGKMHAAEATDEISLHITLGLIPYSWADLLVDCVAEVVERSPEWRTNVPFGFGREHQSGFARTRDELMERIGALPDVVDVESVLLARMDMVGAAHRPRAGDYMQQAMAAAELTEEHVVEPRPDLAYRLEPRDGRIVVHSGSRELDFPANARRTIETALNGRPVRARNIDDGLDWPGRGAVLTTLIREGLVTKRP